MSDEENGFLGRWSRMKRRAREEEAPEAAIPPEEEAPAADLATEPEEEGFDLSQLPSLDSLGPGSDFAPFMRKGVPTALRTAALRKLWVSDADILNYKTLADYDWDFNAPGYGRLLPTDNPRELVERLFAHLKPKEEEEGAAPPDASPAAPADTPPPEPEPVRLPPPPDSPAVVAVALPEVPQDVVEVPEQEDEPSVPRRRRHGGAMPG